MEIYPSKYGRNGIRANEQERKARQDSSKRWIKTATSEDFQQDFSGRPRTIVTSLVEKPHNVYKNQFHRDDYVPLEENRSIGDSLKRRTKYRTTIILVLVSSCVVTLAVALTVVFVFAKPQNRTQDSSSKFFITEGKIEVPQNFTEDLNNKSSDAYRTFTTTFCTVMENGLRTDFPLRRKCYVTDLRKGSIKVSFLLFIETGNRVITYHSLKTVIKTALRNGTGNLHINGSILSLTLKELSNSATLATLATSTLTTIPHETSMPTRETTAAVKTSTTAGNSSTTAAATSSFTTIGAPSFSTEGILSFPTARNSSTAIANASTALVTSTDDPKTLTSETTSEMPTTTNESGSTVPSTSQETSTGASLSTSREPTTINLPFSTCWKTKDLTISVSSYTKSSDSGVSTDQTNNLLSDTGKSTEASSTTSVSSTIPTTIATSSSTS